MINWFDMPAEGLSNGGQFEVKELEVTENGTYEEKGEMYNKVTVNVEGGGGGSSDFSTARVTVSPDDGSADLNGFVPVILDNEGESLITCKDYLENGYNVVLFNGSFFLVTTVKPTYSVSGNASLKARDPIMPTQPTVYILTITGDFTITTGESPK